MPSILAALRLALEISECQRAAMIGRWCVDQWDARAELGEHLLVVVHLDDEFEARLSPTGARALWRPSAAPLASGEAAAMLASR